MDTVLRPASIALLCAPLLSACTSHRAVEGQGDRDPEGEQAPPLVHSQAPAARGDSNGWMAWRWIHSSGEEGGWFADIGPKTIHAGSFECTFTHDDQTHTPGQVCCEGPKRWCVEMRENFVPGIALASNGQRLFVADYPAISSGARLAAYELESGAALWTREAKGIGPQAHSEYFNVVQLRLIRGTLIAYGHEANGSYVEAVDPATGELREHVTLTPPEVQWRWPEPAPEPELAVSIALPGGGECQLESPEQGPTTIGCASAGALAWKQAIEGDFVGRGALVSDGQRVVAVTWSRIANGARARAWALADGALLWDRPIEGIGPQSHSKYSNLIMVDLEGELVIVRGLESHGHYSEALDIATGALRWSIAWPKY